MFTNTAFRKVTSRFFLSLGLLLLTACGTLEIGVEPEVEPNADPLDVTPVTATLEVDEVLPSSTMPVATTPTPSQTSNDLTPESPLTIEVATEVATVLPTPIPQPPMLRVAYNKDNNVWLWTEENGATALTKNGGVDSVLLSDDGQRIAFRRGGNIWAVNSDGSDERQLTTDADFEGISYGEDADPYLIGISPYQIAWQPGTHTLFFNTVPQFEGPGLLLTDDLWATDADTGELISILPRGEGGKLTMSPDGRTIALSTPGTISLFDTNTYDKRQLFTYTPVITYSEFQYYAQPAWASDSMSLAVAIPPADFMASAEQLTSIWTILVDGTSARLVGHIEANGLQGEPLFSPGLSHVIFLTGEPGGMPQPAPVSISEIRQEDTNEVIEVGTYPFQAEALDSWSPAGSHFVFAPPYDGVAPRRQIASLEGEVSDVGEAGMVVFRILWIDEVRYLFLQSNPRGWSILMGYLGSPGVVPIDGVIGEPPSFDADA
jgi:Tol biopolymer transport system component